MKPATLLLRLLLLAISLTSSFCLAQGADYARTIEAIARDIAGLNGSYPQLADFSPAANLRADELKIVYGYRTHKPEGRGGWTSAVPNPDDDGIWFYIDLHDPKSTLQIHTQPAETQAYCIGEKKVSFLSLEGKQTRKIHGAIWQILVKHGAARCD